MLPSVFAELSAFFAFFAFLCFFAGLVSDLVSDLGVEVVSVLPWANAPNETRQNAARAAAIVRIMLISVWFPDGTIHPGVALDRASRVPGNPRKISPIRNEKRPWERMLPRASR